MANTENRVLEIIYDCGGKASVFTIARGIGFNSDYARMICESLGRRDYIDYSAPRGLAILRDKGAEIGKREASQRKKLQETMPGKPSRGRVVLGY